MSLQSLSAKLAVFLPAVAASLILLGCGGGSEPAFSDRPTASFLSADGARTDVWVRLFAVETNRGSFILPTAVKIPAQQKAAVFPVTASNSATGSVTIRIQADPDYDVGTPSAITVSTAAAVDDTDPDPVLASTLLSLVGGDTVVSSGSAFFYNVQRNQCGTSDTVPLVVTGDVGCFMDLKHRPSAFLHLFVMIALVLPLAGCIGGGGSSSSKSSDEDGLPRVSFFSDQQFVNAGQTVPVGVRLDTPATENISAPLIVVQLPEGSFNVQASATIPAGAGETAFTVSALAGAQPGDRVEIQLATGAGYRLGTPSMVVVRVPDEPLPLVSLVGGDAAVCLWRRVLLQRAADRVHGCRDRPAAPDRFTGMLQYTRGRVPRRGCLYPVPRRHGGFGLHVRIDFPVDSPA
jgi:hypothetical protein